ncbi:DUF3332 domain-containing protein [Robertkochia aurantiaca]|uniref:DUF3332 domain-containing protein n=1 Tax=Robertkochia aurantiaca TaxID=2873700 RepID=UPI001CC9710D|nr:DUF3332 domain-containing protein [Robertkochia sp. 3YJGBD-33]
MKKLLVCCLLSSSILFTSCLGSFAAFNNLKDWNMGVSDSKFINNLLFWGLNIIPVYGIFMIGDVFIFNVLEFWTGNNPVAMEEGESELQMVEHDGNTYKMVATKNRMQISIVEGPKKGNKIDLLYKPSERSWNAITPEGEIIKLSSFEDGFNMVYLPDGETIRIDAEMNKDHGIQMINEYIGCYTGQGMFAEAK